METALPVALSAQLAMSKRLDTIAHNVANSRTTGFRADRVAFDLELERLDAVAGGDGESGMPLREFEPVFKSAQRGA